MGVTVLQACVARVGQTRGALAAAAVAQYAIAEYDLGKFPTAVEYADYWAISERTAFRHRARMERVFADDWRVVVSGVTEQIRRRDLERSPRTVMGLEVRAA